MYAVGVGNAVEDELKEIASEPTGEHYFYTADFKAMTQIAKKLQINVCPGLASRSPLTARCSPVAARPLTSQCLSLQTRTPANVTRS